MTTNTSPRDVLFPDELIHWKDFVKLVLVLLYPHRHKATGIGCIAGALITNSFSQPGNEKISWFPCTFSTDHKKTLESLCNKLPMLPKLAYPVSPSLATEFIDEFIQLKNLPEWIPRFLSKADLVNDRNNRHMAFEPETAELQKRIQSGDVYIVNKIRHKTNILDSNAFMTYQEAARHLAAKGLMDRALSYQSSYKALIQEPEIDSDDESNNPYGLPDRLWSLGVYQYRQYLMAQKFQSYLVHFDKLEKNEKHKNSCTNEEETTGTDDTVISTTSCNSISITDVVHQENNTTPRAPIISTETQPSTTSIDSFQNTNNITSSIAPKLLDMEQVTNLLALSRATIHNYICPENEFYKPDFPTPFKVGGTNRWKESDIFAWIDSKINSTSQAPKKASKGVRKKKP